MKIESPEILAEIVMSGPVVRYPTLGYTGPTRAVVYATEKSLDDDPYVLAYRIVEECDKSDRRAIKVDTTVDGRGLPRTRYILRDSRWVRPVLDQKGRE